MASDLMLPKNIEVILDDLPACGHNCYLCPEHEQRLRREILIAMNESDAAVSEYYGGVSNAQNLRDHAKELNDGK